MKWSFFAGLGVGTAIGMLVAPKAGAELRDDLQEYARESYEQGRERLQPAIEQAHEKVQPVADQARQKLEPVVNQVREKVEPAMNEAREKAQPMIDNIRESVDSVMAQGSSVRDRVADESANSLSGANGDLLTILNEWPHERLIEIDGIGPVLATRIIQHRPYRSEQELIDSKELPPSAIESLRKAA